MELSEVCTVFGIDDIGDFSDGFHTFNQLYHQRAILFATTRESEKSLLLVPKFHLLGVPSITYNVLIALSIVA